MRERPSVRIERRQRSARISLLAKLRERPGDHARLGDLRLWRVRHLGGRRRRLQREGRDRGRGAGRGLAPPRQRAAMAGAPRWSRPGPKRAAERVPILVLALCLAGARRSRPSPGGAGDPRAAAPRPPAASRIQPSVPSGDAGATGCRRRRPSPRTSTATPGRLPPARQSEAAEARKAYGDQRSVAGAPTGFETPPARPATEPAARHPSARRRALRAWWPRRRDRATARDRESERSSRLLLL